MTALINPNRPGENAKLRQTQRLQTNAAGVLTWTYPVAYGAGVVPIVTAIAESGAGVTDMINVQINGAPTNTGASFRVARSVPTLIGLLGLILTVIPASVGVQWVHLTAEAP